MALTAQGTLKKKGLPPMLHSLALQAVRLEIAKPGWLFARTCRVVGTVGLFVYRSVEVRDTDKIFAPVIELLNRCRTELVRHEIVEDPKLIGHEGEWFSYLFHGTGSGMKDLIDPKFVEELVVEEKRIHAELVGEGAFLSPSIAMADWVQQGLQHAYKSVKSA